MQIIITGSLAFDQIMVFPGTFKENIMPERLHILSLSFLVDKLHKNFGGVAGNICYNLGMLGKNPICLSCLGEDGEDYEAFLAKNGVDTDYINIVDTDYTASFVVINDKVNCQIAGFYPGAMRNDVNLPLEQILDKDTDNFLVIAPTVPEAMGKYLQIAKARNIRYLFSPAQQIPSLSEATLIDGINHAEVIIGNDYEIALIEKKTGMSRENILEKVKVMITTFGEKGSVIEQKDKPKIEIGVAKPREIKDPTGAGDAYIAGFLSAYLDQKSLIECGQTAATAAVYALEEFGTTAHSFSLNLFENRFKENF
ncbi:carbohydrate kinase family protein [Candidatus Beckwithbacteria bacterium]|nr:carbohydrate kinase family protein [Candidatus Beckwithbacteria bacterium]